MKGLCVVAVDGNFLDFGDAADALLYAEGVVLLGELFEAGVVVFVSGYYGRLSFERKAFDHEKMALLFAAAARRYEAAPDEYETVFRDLAREEIIENGNWMSYCKEDRPTFSL